MKYMDFESEAGDFQDQNQTKKISFIICDEKYFYEIISKTVAIS